MNSLGIVISSKNNEKRRAILPEDLVNIKNKSKLFVERGYGEVLGISDEEYSKYGVNMVSREDALKCDIISDVKIGDADFIDSLEENKILFGWAHAVQNIQFTDIALRNNHTVIAWEEMYENGRYIFYKNREIAGEAAILQAYLYCGKMPYDTKVAILGNGQTARGAYKFLIGLGASVDIYDRKLENLFKDSIHNYDVLVNCVLWDTNRNDRIIYRNDLKRLKKGTLIIDVSCDPNLEIETSRPTTIDNPVYEVDGVIHYAVDNTPAMFPFTTTKVISKGLSCYIDELIEGDYSKVVQKAIVIESGKIVDENIRRFRETRGLFAK
ncbi:N(5)-(carboxyethyl)ornithine synthase [Bhargavaea beijingensis]|uniref:N(5)-(Carboxyethyl)ornithine synthase n=1 Tax=Bhargavaea beijingensis TaxID=426756 RepID=A0ABX9ZDI9_9BACL|nr:N(5)-(carboxyethyl)ornithine synthase [Bhargavaea beijingensis]RSK33700.1 N(5)-(carboxyethyl)ornithine synthase [Bhargavaea beijingensis]